MREGDRFRIDQIMVFPGQPAEWSITINDWVPDSRLLLNGRNRVHWGTIKSCKERTKQVIRDFLDGFPGSTDVTFSHGRVAIEFEYVQKRRRDPDNLAGLVKPIMDALVEAGVLVDDDCEHVDLTIKARTTGRSATTIEITGPVAAEPERQMVLLAVAKRDAERPKRRRATDPRKPPQKKVKVPEGLPF